MVCLKDSSVKLTMSLFAFLVILSCFRTIDITENEIFRGNYRKGMVLLLKKDVLIMKNNMLWDRQLDIDNAKEGGLYDYYKGLLKKGNKLVIERVELFQHIENGNSIYPIGTLLTGEWKGEEVNLYFASKSSDIPENDSHHIDILDVDTDLFEIVTTGGESRNGQ